MSLGNEFQVFLPSNVILNETNTSGKYETSLARPIELNGSWECAIIDITYPNSWVYKIHIQNECKVIILGYFRDSERAVSSTYNGDDSDQDLVRYGSTWAITESRERRAAISNQPYDNVF